MIRPVTTLLALLCTAPVTTETIEVPGRGAIDLAPFACTDTPRSTVVQRVCYDEARGLLLVNAGGTYSQYCGLPAGTFDAFVSAASMGQFYRQRILATPAKYDCTREGKN